MSQTTKRASFATVFAVLAIAAIGAIAAPKPQPQNQCFDVLIAGVGPALKQVASGE